MSTWQLIQPSCKVHEPLHKMTDSKDALPKWSAKDTYKTWFERFEDHVAEKRLSHVLDKLNAPGVLPGACLTAAHFKTVALGVIAVLFTCLFLVTQKTTHTPVSYPYAGTTGYMGWFINGGVILLFFTHNSVIQTIFFGGLILVQQPP